VDDSRWHRSVVGADGFTTSVDTLDLREGGELVYTMTATAPEAIEFMTSAGMPLATVSRKRFTRIQAPSESTAGPGS
jgi:hypothetical protein